MLAFAVQPAEASVSQACGLSLDAMLADTNYQRMNETFTRWCRVKLESDMALCCSDVADFERGYGEGCQGGCMAQCLHHQYKHFCNEWFGTACVVTRVPFSDVDIFQVEETFCVPNDCLNGNDQNGLMTWYSASYESLRAGWHEDYTAATLSCPSPVGTVLTAFAIIFLVLGFCFLTYWFVFRAPPVKGSTMVSQAEMNDSSDDEEVDETFADTTATLRKAGFGDTTMSGGNLPRGGYGY